jgi:uncharacterized protein YeaO (DUF488 family)
MVTLKWVYEPVAQVDGLRVLVERRWPRGLDKADAAIDRWEKGIAPSVGLQRWFGGRRKRWAEFRERYAFELDQHGEELARLRALAAEHPLTLLFAARDQAYNSAAVLKDILLRSRQPGVAEGNMSGAELLGFLNSVLASSRTAVKEAKAILKSAATQMLDIQRDEAYACAVLIQLIKSLGGRLDYGIEQPDDTSGVAGLAPRLALFVQNQIRTERQLQSNLRRVADDRVRHRLQKLLIARVRNIRNLDGGPHLPVARPEPSGRC